MRKKKASEDMEHFLHYILFVSEKQSPNLNSRRGKSNKGMNTGRCGSLWGIFKDWLLQKKKNHFHTQRKSSVPLCGQNSRIIRHFPEL